MSGRCGRPRGGRHAGRMTDESGPSAGRTLDSTREERATAATPPGPLGPRLRRQPSRRTPAYPTTCLALLRINASDPTYPRAGVIITPAKHDESGRPDAGLVLLAGGPVGLCGLLGPCRTSLTYRGPDQIGVGRPRGHGVIGMELAANPGPTRAGRWNGLAPSNCRTRSGGTGCAWFQDTCGAAVDCWNLFASGPALNP